MGFPWGRSKLVDEEGGDVEITYPRFTYLVEWRHGWRRLKPNALHFQRELTQSQIRGLVRSLGRDSFTCRMTHVTGRRAKVKLSAVGLQSDADNVQ
jgi:hypothetical protein